MKKFKTKLFLYKVLVFMPYFWWGNRTWTPDWPPSAASQPSTSCTRQRYKERMRHTQRKNEKRKEWIHAVIMVVPCHKLKKVTEINMIWTDSILRFFICYYVWASLHCVTTPLHFLAGLNRIYYVDFKLTEPLTQKNLLIYLVTVLLDNHVHCTWI